jgi:hypothetical protein
MNAATLASSVVRRVDAMRTTGAALGVFAVTIFLSALLLFSVQPMFAKMVLPKLGGSPSVWAVSMCFFQAGLLGGYCYAHALNRWLSTRHATFVHLTLLAVALLALPIGLPAFGHEPPAGDAYGWLIGVLAVGVGLPFFAVSANAPLLQSWFARTGHPHAADPYFLYAASNLGSLIALLAYPILLEPAAGAVAQAALWTVGFVGLVLAIAACGALAWTRTEADDATSGAKHVAEVAAEPSPTWEKCAEWVGLAFVPSGLLVAYTTYLTTDIASAPLLWVLPLAAFLMTFVLVFRDKPVIPHAVLLLVQPLLVVCAILGFTTIGAGGRKIAAVASTCAFLVTMLVAHRELFERRPGVRHLTEFYLWMSVGGVLGGVFAALVAPQAFTNTWELPLLLVLGLLCRPGIVTSRDDADMRKTLLASLGALVVFAAIAMVVRAGLVDWVVALTRAIVLGLALAAIVWRASAVRQTAAVALAFAALVLLPSAMKRGDAERSFFGVHRVAETPDGQLRVLYHGTTIHGAERISDAAGKPVTGAPPLTYYHPEGPMARSADIARAATGKSDGTLKAGVVGLGAGSMACFAKPGESWRFYEIDPVVMRIARDPSRFTLLSRCAPGSEIVLGDARLTLGKTAPGAYDLLMIDAFSSDAVPAHLLTVEALQLYLSRLAPEGVLAMHISNRYLDLTSVVAAIVAAVPGAHAVLANDYFEMQSLDAVPSRVVFIAKSEKALAAARAMRFAATMPKAEVAPWTDDYSDIITAMRRMR